MVKPYYSYGCSVYYIYGQIFATFMVGGFITFMVKLYYSYGCSVNHVYDQILFHLWLVELSLYFVAI